MEHSSEASRIEIARPLPMPVPRQPAPVTMATLPFREREGGTDGISESIVIVQCWVVEFDWERGVK